MTDRRMNLIFVNDRPYHVRSGQSLFRTEDFLRDFDSSYHLQIAKLLEPGLKGENPDSASLAIRTIHGLAAEAFFALFFSVLQAPDVPAAWLLLYKPGDIEKLLCRLESGEPFPHRFELAPSSWLDVARALIPATEEDQPGATVIVQRFSDFWGRLAADFRSTGAKNEFNSLKHGLRARAASPFLSIDGHVVPSAEHGSSFPILNRKQNDVVLSIGCRSWSASCLLAQLELIFASIKNLLALLKQLHGIEEHLIVEIPDEGVFEAATPSKDQILSSLAFTTEWPEAKPLDREKALAAYQQLGRFRVVRR